MARFDQRSGHLYMTDLGRIASHFYIRHDSIATINEMFGPRMKARQSDVSYLFVLAVACTLCYSVCSQVCWDTLCSSSWLSS
jgi:replicative superfamily II helicase